jgi:hypothetical protein
MYMVCWMDVETDLGCNCREVVRLEKMLGWEVVLIECKCEKLFYTYTHYRNYQFLLVLLLL